MKKARVSGPRLSAARRREQILDSAVAVFGRKGFEGTTTRELAQSAGVSEAMIFRFFPDKATLYRAIIDRFIASSGDPFPHAAARLNNDREVLAGLAESLIRNMEQDPAFVRLLLFSALEEHELSGLFLEARVLRLTRTLARYLARRMEAGAFRAAPPLLSARVFLGMACHYALMNNLYGPTLPGRLPRASAARLCASVFLDGLQPRERAVRSLAPRTRRRAVRPLARALGCVLAFALTCSSALLVGCSGGANGAPQKAAPTAQQSDQSTGQQPAPSSSPSAGQPGSSSAAPPGARVLRVATQPAALQDVTFSIDAVGSLEAQEEVQIVAGVEGVVTSVRFHEGDVVTTSTVLATIDPERFRMEAERAGANVDKTEAQHRQALSDLKRREELLQHDPPLISEEEVERARQEGERLKAAVAEAAALHELAKLDQQRSIVRPLVGGIIDSKTVVTGQHVEAKAVLATLVNTASLNIRFKVSEQESVRLREGMQVRFTTASRPGREFDAKVFHVSSTADPSTRMVECLARVANSGGDLKPGFFAEVQADVESRKGVVVIPERAVLSTDKGFVVFEVVDGKALQRRVSLGMRTKDGGVEIASGLTPQAQIVTDGGDILRDGVPVQVVGSAGR